jgi:hypothetical protein
MEENMRNWPLVVGVPKAILFEVLRNEGFSIAVAKGPSAIRSFLKIASLLLAASCTSVMVQTPQQMSDFAINDVNAAVDPRTDPNPQTLAFDQTACANKARLEYPIVHIDEGGIMASSILSGAVGGAGSGAAASAGTGHAGQAAAAGAVGGIGQGGLNGMAKIKNVYVMQAYQQMIHYALCLVQQGHPIYGHEQDLECASVGLGCPKLKQ